MSGCDPIVNSAANSVINYFVERGEKRNAAMCATLRFSGGRISEIVRCIRRKDFIRTDGRIANSFELLQRKTSRRKSNVFKLAVRLVLEAVAVSARPAEYIRIKTAIESKFDCEEPPKSYRRRKVLIPERYKPIIEDWLNLQDKQGKQHSNDYVFDISRQQAWNIVKRAYRDLELVDGKLALHSWRGGLLEDVFDLTQELNRQGLTDLDPLAVARDAAGHTSRKNTEIYIKKHRGDSQELISKALTEC